ncbi:MAG: hypothetical protein D6681_21210 [Calditrichaeota bacterium]|nr:MAG: hypothetical protein D6681_21210 [Calditrichota bacterium]
MKPEAQQDEVRRVALAIINYLREYPSARDTAEGIARWWVGEDEALVRQALETLVEAGVMEKRGEQYQLAFRKPRKRGCNPGHYLRSLLQRLKARFR